MSGACFSWSPGEPSKNKKGACVLASSLLLDVATPSIKWSLNCRVCSSQYGDLEDQSSAFPTYDF